MSKKKKTAQEGAAKTGVEQNQPQNTLLAVKIQRPAANKIKLIAPKKGEDGLIDPADGRNLVFLGNLDRRQRRVGAEKGAIPNKSAAKLEKYKARYLLWHARYQAKINNLILSGVVEASKAGAIAGIRAGLRFLPERMKRHDVLKNAENWLYEQIVAIIRAAPSAGSIAVHRYGETGPRWTDPAEDMPEKAPEKTCVDEVIALLERLIACRYKVEHAAQSGILIKKEEAEKQIMNIGSQIKALLLPMSRRITAQLQSALGRGGIREARRVLAGEIESTIARITLKKKTVERMAA